MLMELIVCSSRFGRYASLIPGACLEEIRHLCRVVGCVDVARRRETGQGFELARQMRLIGKAEVACQRRPGRRVRFGRRCRHTSESDDARKGFRRNSEMPRKLALELTRAEACALARCGAQRLP